MNSKTHMSGIEAGDRDDLLQSMKYISRQYGAVAVLEEAFILLENVRNVQSDTVGGRALQQRLGLAISHVSDAIGALR